MPWTGGHRQASAPLLLRTGPDGQVPADAGLARADLPCLEPVSAVRSRVDLVVPARWLARDGRYQCGGREAEEAALLQPARVSLEVGGVVIWGGCEDASAAVGCGSDAAAGWSRAKACRRGTMYAQPRSPAEGNVKRCRSTKLPIASPAHRLLTLAREREVLGAERKAEQQEQSDRSARCSARCRVVYCHVGRPGR